MSVLSRIGLGLLGLLVFVGCGDGRKSVYPTSGSVVTATGKPAVGVSVVFNPIGKGDESAHTPAAIVGADGTFKLTTYLENDGAPPGDYAVTVEWRAPQKNPGAPEKPDKLGGKFRDRTTTPFKFAIKPGDNVLDPIKLP